MPFVCTCPLQSDKGWWHRPRNLSHTFRSRPVNRWTEFDFWRRWTMPWDKNFLRLRSSVWLLFSGCWLFLSKTGKRTKYYGDLRPPSTVLDQLERYLHVFHKSSWLGTCAKRDCRYFSVLYIIGHEVITQSRMRLFRRFSVTCRFLLVLP
jgi:hypothetical protein